MSRFSWGLGGLRRLKAEPWVQILVVAMPSYKVLGKLLILILSFLIYKKGILRVIARSQCGV